MLALLRLCSVEREKQKKTKLKYDLTKYVYIVAVAGKVIGQYDILIFLLSQNSFFNTFELNAQTLRCLRNLLIRSMI